MGLPSGDFRLHGKNGERMSGWRVDFNTIPWKASIERFVL